MNKWLFVANSTRGIRCSDMWKTLTAGIAVGLLFSLLTYLSVDKINGTAKQQTLTSSEDLAEAMAERKQVEKQLAELTSKPDDGTSIELDQDIAILKNSLANVAGEIKKICSSGKPPGISAPTPPGSKSIAPFDAPGQGDPRWQEVETLLSKVQRQYSAIDQRYVSSNQSRLFSLRDASAATAQSDLDEINARVRGANRGWGAPASNTVDACNILSEHRAIANVDTSSIVTPFLRVKQRVERERVEIANRLNVLNSRAKKLEEELGSLESRLAEGPKLIVVKYLPLAMAIILAFGALLFVAARIIPDPILERLVDSGQLIQFPTVVILFAVILVLALAEGLTKDHTATLLAAIAGYILGSTRNGSGKSGPNAPPGSKDPPPEVEGENPSAKPSALPAV